MGKLIDQLAELERQLRFDKAMIGGAEANDPDLPGAKAQFYADLAEYKSFVEQLERDAALGAAVRASLGRLEQLHKRPAQDVLRSDDLFVEDLHRDIADTLDAEAQS